MIYLLAIFCGLGIALSLAFVLSAISLMSEDYKDFQTRSRK